MLIHRSKKDLIEFAEVEPIEAELLRQVSTLCNLTEDPKVEERLFSPPTDSSEVQFLDDWEEYIKPELHHLFVSARKLVEDDLAKLQGDNEEGGRFFVPLAHGDAWLNTLNQARLILATRYDFSEVELSSSDLPKSFSRRELVLLQINFYATIQERIIDVLEASSGEN